MYAINPVDSRTTGEVDADVVYAEVGTMTVNETKAGTAAASVTGITKVYGSGEAAVAALDGIDLDIYVHDFTAIMGPSGSGKSTLLHCMAGLDIPTAGEVRIGGQSLSTMKNRELTMLRRDQLGFVFQAFNLMPTLTALENILLPCRIAGREPDQVWLDTVIQATRLSDRLNHRPAELSGGQQQRVACARALVSRPRVIFADEPTGNLDSKSSLEVLRFLKRSVQEFDQTVVMVTHDPVAASYCDRIIFLLDGRVVSEMREPTREVVLQRLAELEPDQGA